MIVFSFKPKPLIGILRRISTKLNGDLVSSSSLCKIMDLSLTRMSSLTIAFCLSACIQSTGTIRTKNIQNIVSPPSSCFTPVVQNPLLTKDSLFSGSDWNDPSVIKENNEFVMYASSDLNLDINVKVYRLISTDGLHWILSPSTPVLTGESSSGAWDHKSVETPSVVKFNGIYHLFYTGYPEIYNKVEQYKIGHATSTDGITWTKDAGPLIEPSSVNASIIGEPGAIEFSNKIYLYFTAIINDLQVIAVQTFDGSVWTAPSTTLVPDNNLYPRSQWIGYSTPQPVVINGAVQLFFDVATANPWNQEKIHRAISTDGLSGWVHDTKEIFDRRNFTWTYQQIRAPALLLDNNTLYLWFAGEVHNPTRLGIGLAVCTSP